MPIDCDFWLQSMQKYDWFQLIGKDDSDRVSVAAPVPSHLNITWCFRCSKIGMQPPAPFLNKRVAYVNIVFFISRKYQNLGFVARFFLIRSRELLAFIFGFRNVTIFKNLLY